ncbi:MAG TPA: cytochrome P450 [Aldersonia sp.]
MPVSLLTGALDTVLAEVTPEHYFRWRRARSGDPFEVRFPGLGRVLFTAHPDGARDIFRAPPDTFVTPLPNPIAPLVGEASLILVDGERHRRDRALLMPPFHGQRMRAYGEIIRESARAEIRTWRAGSRFDSRQAARAITLRVILEAVFGLDGRDRRDEYTTTVADLLASYNTALLLVPPLRRGVFGLAPWDRFVRLRDRFDALLDEDVDRRRGLRQTGDDVLSMLLATRYDDGSPLDDGDLREQLRTLLVAGHETTATSIAWALYHVHRHPAVRERLVAEVRALGPDVPAEDLARLPYLDAVCKETLRLHPPVPVVLRRLAAPLEIRGVGAPAGATVGVALELLHTHRDVWGHPRRFDPQRFLDRRYGPFEYAPYGGGHRRCVGFALAEYELRIVLATILAEASIALPADAAAAPIPASVPANIATGPWRPIVFDVLAENRGETAA